jgi:ribosomal protein S18 acetylase RimI-like enzyme
MHIRKLTIDDAHAFRELRIEMCDCHPEAFHQTPEEVADMPDDKLVEWMSPSDVFPEKFILACFDGDRMIGTAAFRRQDSFKECHRGWIWSVYVRPEGRGKGISRQLMQQLIDEVRRIDGLEMLTLTVSVTQTSARTLYTSLGFFTTGLILHGYKLPDGRYIDEEEMTLWL